MSLSHLHKLGSAPDLYASGSCTLPLGAPKRARLTDVWPWPRRPPSSLTDLRSLARRRRARSCTAPSQAPILRPYLASHPTNPTPVLLKMAQNRHFCRHFPLQMPSCGADRRPWRSPADPSCRIPCKYKKRADRSFPISPHHLFFSAVALRCSPEYVSPSAPTWDCQPSFRLPQCPEIPAASSRPRPLPGAS